MTQEVAIPGGRAVTGTLDESRERADREQSENGSAGVLEATGCIVACPPHPQHGGHRGDARVTATSEALRERGIDCLRIDYGAWDEGLGECEDARNALRWAAQRYDRLGLYGYSFGGAVALLAAERIEHDIDGVATLAPAPRLGEDRERDAVAALETLLDDTDTAVQVLAGERDSTVDSTPLLDILDRAGSRSRHDGQTVSADHFFVGQQAEMADNAAGFLLKALRY